ncbi:MAG: lysophospholipid acyltransferase family protein [Gammaproteobacteria bacterium]|nr:lysophospholipid acyltransferase family protein [Gammaproteobacteria bacterium]
MYKENSAKSVPGPPDEVQGASRLARMIGGFVLFLSGWQVKGSVPKNRKMVIIAAPHTSNWDLIFLLAAAYRLGLSINWIGKKALFVPLLGYVFRWLGGIPVERGKKLDTVGQLVSYINNADQVALVIAPEGTRSFTPMWKSGFYHIAAQAGIPLVCGYLDYERKEAGLGPALPASGNIGSDMEIIRHFYQPITARYPEKKGPICLQEEIPGQAQGENNDS